MNEEDQDPASNGNSEVDSDRNSSSITVEVNAENEQQRTSIANAAEVPANEPLKQPEFISLGQCTIKEILSEILDFTIVNKPTTSCGTENTTERFSKKLSILFPSTHSEATGCTMKEVISKILDYTVHPANQSSFSETGLGENIVNYAETAGASNYFERNNLASELGILEKEDHIFRILNTKPINSERAVHVVREQPPPTSTSLKSLGHLLPTYSAVLKSGPPRPVPHLIKPIESSSSFIPRQPPPSYAEVEGIWEDLRSMISSESVIYGPDPIYIVCPRCRRIVVTRVDQEHSSLTHITAALLFLCLCWPCCFLPYCFKWCTYSYHTCPTCHHFFGMHRPF